VHCSLEKHIKWDFIVKVECNNQKVDGYVRIRPGLKQFLQNMNKHFEVGIFTAG